MRERHPSRRVLLAALAGAAASAWPRGARAQGGPGPGLQLFTVRAAMAQDVPGTLARIAAVGYREVEFAGYFDTPPARIRRVLADNGLAAPAAHLNVAPAALRDSPAQWIDAAAEAGHRFLVLPWLDVQERRTLDQYRALADTMNVFAELCRAAGLAFAYHNHDFEFAALDGVPPFDLLMQRCDPDLVGFELDLYWAVHAGRDPRAVLAQYPGRFPLCHVKDRAPGGAMADVGAGTIDFAAIFASPDAAFRHYFVERDDAPDGLASAAASFGPARAAVEAAGRR